MIYLVILMIFVGIELIGHVPSVLHTPLMSGANAIHGVVLIGAIYVLGHAKSDDIFSLVADRMLEMFKKKPGKGGKA